MQPRRLLAPLVALVVASLIAAGLTGLPAALGSTGALAVALLCCVLVLGGVVSGVVGVDARTVYW